jgi:hypothetical protein
LEWILIPILLVVLLLVAVWGLVLLWLPAKFVLVLFEGFRPLLRSALKNPRFSVRTALAGTAIFAFTFTLLRISGVFDRWQNSSEYYLAALFFGGVSLLLSLGAACMLSMLFDEATILFSKRRGADDAPDFHFLEQLPEPPADKPAWPVASDNPQELNNPPQNAPVELSKEETTPMDFAHFTACSEKASAESSAAMQTFLGPHAVDHAIRQALSVCWMVLPTERRNFETIETEIRRLVDRALAKFKEDCQAFGVADAACKERADLIPDPSPVE